ncbi:hypothetical protein [Arthrobacter sp. StoSoilB20]|uniref:hypothetical protein n=1 Tax=Arthrobacter sp. StoSoilB20 TaxID=2830995 RepID=UPI001CC519E0|nr:hypothetical protein [Arthrobacter sp. StoSoilB20]BCW59586.1 hypothetical protein StoSoilB20_29330 [Arthrobacter sp. StoSoilB20]
MTRRTHVDPSTPDKPPAAEPCYECPFRTTNEHKQITYEVDGINEFARIWWEISRQGRTYGCHMAERDCAGAVNMIANELEKLQRYATWDQYHDANPLGLAPELIGPFLAKFSGRDKGKIPVADPNRIILQILATKQKATN